MGVRRESWWKYWGGQRRLGLIGEGGRDRDHSNVGKSPANVTPNSTPLASPTADSTGNSSEIQTAPLFIVTQ